MNLVVICLKIRTFVVSATTAPKLSPRAILLWFAWKFVPLWYQQQPGFGMFPNIGVVICLKIRTFVVSATTNARALDIRARLWFAWKFVPLWYQQQLSGILLKIVPGCDLLENSYLCGISNNHFCMVKLPLPVVICLKIRTFVVSATTDTAGFLYQTMLWFAWKFVPLWYQQQQWSVAIHWWGGCDLLENSYLCGISNNI